MGNYSPLKEFGKRPGMFFMEDHMNPAGYVLMADMVCAYIDYIIRHNMRDFDEIVFIGTQLTNHPKKMSEK